MTEAEAMKKYTPFAFKPSWFFDRFAMEELGVPSTDICIEDQAVNSVRMGSLEI